MLVLDQVQKIGLGGWAECGFPDNISARPQGALARLRGRRQKPAVNQLCRPLGAGSSKRSGTHAQFQPHPRANPEFSPSSHEASATDHLCRVAASSAARSAVAPHYPFVYPCEHQRRANAKDAGSPSRYFPRIFGRGLPLRKSPPRNFWLPRPRAPSRRRSRLSRFDRPGMASNNPPLRRHPKPSPIAAGGQLATIGTARPKPPS